MRIHGCDVGDPHTAPAVHTVSWGARGGKSTFAATLRDVDEKRCNAARGLGLGGAAPNSSSDGSCRSSGYASSASAHESRWERVPERDVFKALEFLDLTTPLDSIMALDSTMTLDLAQGTGAAPTTGASMSLAALSQSTVWFDVPELWFSGESALSTPRSFARDEKTQRLIALQGELSTVISAQ